MNEFIEKLIDKIENEAFAVQLEKGIKHPSTLDAMMEKFSVFRIKEIVNQLAEEYNNGWIPCSEKKPRMIDAVLVCKKDGFMTVAIRGQAGKFCDTYANVLDDVGAWMPLPEPFKPKGE